MRGLKVTSAMVVFFAMTWAGCVRDIYNVQDAPILPSGSSPPTLEQVKEAIMKSRGTNIVDYEMYDIEPGLIRCDLIYKHHNAVVKIPYTRESYSILYESSQNLSYQPASTDNAAVIHRHYNTWIRFLDASIKKNLALVQSTSN